MRHAPGGNAWAVDRRGREKRQLGKAVMWRWAMVGGLAGSLGEGESGVAAAPCHRNP